MFNTSSLISIHLEIKKTGEDVGTSKEPNSEVEVGVTKLFAQRIEEFDEALSSVQDIFPKTTNKLKRVLR